MRSVFCDTLPVLHTEMEAACPSETLLSMYNLAELSALKYVLNSNCHRATPFIRSAISVLTECDKDYTVSTHERQVAQEQ